MKWKLRDIIVAAILSVVCGALYMGWDFFTQVATAAWNPALQGTVNGVWWLAAGLVPYIIRRPGAAFFAEVVSAFCEFAFGSPYKFGAVISGIVQGIGAEAGFALGGWKRYNVGFMMLSGALAGVGNTLQWLFQYQGDQYHIGTIIGYTVLTLISGAVLGGLLPKWIGDALNRTGSLRNFAIGKESQARLAAAATARAGK